MKNRLFWLAVLRNVALYSALQWFPQDMSTTLASPVLRQTEQRRHLTSSCPSSKTTRGPLNTCLEQQKCFSISYEKLDDPDKHCEQSTCNFKWKVCIDINRDNPCCTKKTKQAFQSACIRGNEPHSCLNDSFSLDKINEETRIRFGSKFCESVQPGQNATFQLVREHAWKPILSFQFNSPSSSVLGFSFSYYPVEFMNVAERWKLL